MDGVDVSNLAIAGENHIPGNPLDGNWKVIFFVDDKATARQHDALVDAFTGKLGGPIKGIANLYGEILAVDKAPILFDVKKGKGHLKIGADLEAEMSLSEERPAALRRCSTPPFRRYRALRLTSAKRRDTAQKNLALASTSRLQGHNAIQGHFRFER